MRCSARFEIDIISALSSQLVAAFEKLDEGELTEEQLTSLDPGQGVYQLFYKGALVYVGQAKSLKRRLTEHRTKISGRRNIDVASMGFNCLYVHQNWTALAPEVSLIKHYNALGKDSCPWNGNGFGPHDPGRQRETTNKPTEGYDAQYPIRDEWPCSWVKAGRYNAQDLLKSLKEGLPYLLRFQTDPDLVTIKVGVPSDSMPARELLRLAAKNLPGWQATVFPGHMILYKETKHYDHGQVIWPPA